MRTAVGAASFDDLFETIDKMTVVELLRFNLRLRWYLIGKIAEQGL